MENLVSIVKHYNFYDREGLYKLLFSLEPLDRHLIGVLRAIFDNDTCEMRIALNMYDSESHEGPSRITLHDSPEDADDEYFYCVYFESLEQQVDYELLYQKMLDHEWAKNK